ncbi:MAG: VCBS repeat-containing protein [Planctomycetes bacterium]|nr:VCBS repeat-containing protein [Planctomycetota bacterium]
MTFADLDGDGILDLLVRGLIRDINFDRDTALPLLLGNGGDGRGDGTFRLSQTPFFTLTGGPFARDPSCAAPFAEAEGAGVAADFDNDGVMEIGFLARFSTTPVRAVLPATREFFIECDADSILAEDIDDDHRPDLILASGSFGSVGLFRGLSANTPDGYMPGAPDGVQTYDAGASPARLDAADFNRDGVPDLVLVNRGTDQLSILLGEVVGPNDDFARPLGAAAGSYGRRTAYTFAAEPTEFAVADLNRDGLPDLAVLLGTARKVAFLLSDAATGTHTVEIGFDIPGIGALLGITAADFDSDGIPDLAVGGEALRIFIGRGGIVGD